MPLAAWELEHARRVLGREPTREELALLEATWSEHCSYKSTRSLLAKLPREAPWVLVGPGRDAGVVRLWDDVALAARIESHNHPSAVDPYNGAATGVGGVVRDILSVGAEPVAVLDSLYLGPLGDPRSLWQARGIVEGISGYGNRIGVPTVGGSTWVGEGYRGQPLVNVAALGLLPPDAVLEGRVEPGDVIVLAGNTTGRDGLHGSSFASRPLDEGEESLAAIQVGNPFLEKLLIDALVEAYRRRLLRHVKDLGGGGLAVAVAETAASSGVGAVVHLDRVHLREPGMEPAEILVSESQERMLLVPYRGRLGELLELLDRYGVEASVIGYFTGGRRLVFKYRGLPVVDMPVSLAVEPPRVERPWHPPPPPPPLPQGLFDDVDLGELLLRVLSSPRVAWKSPVYEAYDWGVGGRAVAAPGYTEAAVLWLRDGSRRGVAAAVAGNPRYTRLSPRRGAALALLEAYRRVAAVGGEPLAWLDNVNSGSPEEPGQHGYTVEMVEGLAWAAGELGIPVIGGNVSLYNVDSEGRMVDPVATVMVVGRVWDVSRVPQTPLTGRGVLVLAGAETRAELGGSEAAELLAGRPLGEPPRPLPTVERRLAAFAGEAVRRGLVLASKSVGLGGVAAAAAKMAARGGVGLELRLDRVCGGCSPVEAAFSETPARLLLEAPRERLPELVGLAERHGVEARVVGEPLGERVLRLSAVGGVWEIPLAEARRALERGLEPIRGPGVVVASPCSASPPGWGTGPTRP